MNKKKIIIPLATVFCLIVGISIYFAVNSYIHKDKKVDSSNNQKVDTNNYTEINPEEVSVEATNENTEEQLVDVTSIEKNSKLQILNFGNNKVKFLLNDSNIHNVLSDDSYSKIIFIHFLKDGELKTTINIKGFEWSFMHYDKIDISSNNQMPDVHLYNQNNPFGVESDTLFFEIVHSDILSLLLDADRYVVSYWDPAFDVSETLEEGEVSSILTQKEAEEKISFNYIDDNQVIITISSKQIISKVNKEDYYDLKLLFYLPRASMFEHSYELSILANLEHTASSFNFIELNYEDDANGSRTYNNKIIQSETANAKIVDDKILIQLKYENIKGLLSSIEKLDLSKNNFGNNELLLSESYKNACEIDQPLDQYASLIPDVFESNKWDGKYFYPLTDDFIISMIEIPLSTTLEYAYGRSDGREIYAPANSYEAPLKIICITSYNEFGIVDYRTKIIYKDLYEAMTAPASRLDYLSTENFTGDQKHDDKIRAEFFEALDQEFFGTPSQNQNSLASYPYEYFGHFDNIRYFKSPLSSIGSIYNFPPYVTYDKDSGYNQDGFLYETKDYHYDFPDFTISQSVMRESKAKVTSYYSKAKK